jgi:hypothetical protein
MALIHLTHANAKVLARPGTTKKHTPQTPQHETQTTRKIFMPFSNGGYLFFPAFINKHKKKRLLHTMKQALNPFFIAKNLISAMC